MHDVFIRVELTCSLFADLITEIFRNIRSLLHPVNDHCGGFKREAERNWVGGQVWRNLAVDQAVKDLDKLGQDIIAIMDRVRAS